MKFKNIILVCLLLILTSNYLCQGKSLCSAAQKTTCKKLVKSFKVIQDENEKFWFVDPQGKKFLSIGINNITHTAWRPKPNTVYYDALNSVFNGNLEGWKKSVNKLLVNNGFNTIGSWSDPNLSDSKLYNTICLYVADYARERCLESIRPGFEDKVRVNIKNMLNRYKSLENVMGFFLDNEMAWYGKSGWDDIPNYTLLEVALELDKNDPARQKVKDFFINKYKTTKAFSAAWGRKLNSWDDINVSFSRSCLNDNTQKDRSDFTSYVAEEFFRISSEVVREMVPGKLILGVRFAGRAPESVIKACGKYCDVLSYNNYQISSEPDEEMLIKYYILSGKKPVMITEYSWRAEENQSGCPNSRGAGTVVKTQAERANRYMKYNKAMFEHSMVIGTHWFEFTDQSPQGRFDGEDSNYGIVDIYNKPYAELLNIMKQTNSVLMKIHAQSNIKAPTKLPPRPKVVFEIGQHPEKPASVDLLKVKTVEAPGIFKAADAEIRLSKMNSNSLAVDYNTGKEWGCGISFSGPEIFAIKNTKRPASNLDGYSMLILDAKIPENVTFNVVVDEAGVDTAGLEKYDRSAGDDGESFIFKTQSGNGERKVYTMHLKDLLERKAWGNQKGSKRVNMNALKGVSICLHGGQELGTIEIYSLKFSR